MQTEFTLTQKEYIQAGKLYAKPTFSYYVIFTTFFIATVALLFFSTKYVYKSMALSGLTAGVFCHLFIRHIYVPWYSRRQYQSYQAAKEPTFISISDTGISFKSQIGQATLTWPRIIKWRQNEALILIYQAPAVYHIIPKRIGAVANELSGLLTKNVGNAT